MRFFCLAFRAYWHCGALQSVMCTCMETRRFSQEYGFSCCSCRSRNMQCQKLFQANAPINCVCLHPNQAAVVVGDQTGALHLWDLVRDTSQKVVCNLPQCCITDCDKLVCRYFIPAKFESVCVCVCVCGCGCARVHVFMIF